MNKPRNKIIYHLFGPFIIVVLLVFSLLTPLLVNQIVSILDDNTHDQVVNYGLLTLNSINANVEDIGEKLKLLIDIPVIEEALAENNTAELTKLLLPVKINQEFDFIGSISHDKKLNFSFNNDGFPVEGIMALDIIDRGVSGVRSSSLYFLNNSSYIIGVVSSSARDNPNIIIAGKALDIGHLTKLIGTKPTTHVFIYNSDGEVFNQNDKDKGIADKITPQIMERLKSEREYLIIDGLHNKLRYRNFYAPLFFNNSLQGFIELHFPLDELLYAKNRIISFTLLIVSACILMILLTGYISSKWLSGRLKKMLYATEQISAGNLDYKLTDASKDELGSLSSSFNGMVFSLKAFTEKLANENRTRKMAEKGLIESREQLSSIMNTANDAILSSDSRGNIIFANNAVETVFGYPPGELINMHVSVLIPERYHDAHNKGFERVVNTGEARIIGKTINMFALRKNESEFPVELSLSMWRSDGEIFFAAIIRDITKRVESEILLKKSESKFKALFEHSTDSVIILRMFQNEARIIDLNPASLKIFRAGHEAMFNMPLTAISPPMQPDKQYSKDRIKEFVISALSGEPQFFEWRYKRFDNTYFDAEVVLNAILLDGEHYLNAIIRDITDRRLMTMQMVMEKERAETYFNIAGVILLVLDDKGYISSINKKGLDTMGYKRDEVIGKLWFEFIPEVSRREIKAVFFKLMGGKIVNTEYYENDLLCKDGNHRLIAWHNTLLKNNDGAVIGTLSSGEDITERKKSEETAVIQLDRLKALHAMDMAITSSFDLNMILNIFMDNIILLMKADAAFVYLMHEASFMLEHILSRGFTSAQHKNEMVRLGDSTAGRAVIERKTILIPDMKDIVKHFPDSQLYEKEGFVSYIAVPLISKGNIKGVLEIFHRTRFEPDDDWLDFINALSIQAALAIDDTTIFQELQDSNIELSVAYDSTLEVWAKTLELKDMEPAGHSERVTDMTLRIGKELGISNRELINMRQGALLHDIGKLGTPDSILFKPGKLTEEEWEVIKSHTTTAYDLLYRIKQLRPVLSIPLYHHEKWDGTGYPKGLKGTEIPISARVFAIVDVWDSLLSDRPYRAAWPREKILEYIRSGSGRHFDPQVVEIFLRIV